ncbi:hypothetical protein D3C72_884480 [compost metagenome]
MTGRLCRLRRVPRDILRGGGHFLHRRGDLIDLGHLFLNADVGTNGDVSGVFRGIADALYRRHHLRDHRLQLGQKGVEALGDRAQFITAIAAQASGQITFALRDVIEHRDHLFQRSGDAVADQPDHQQAEAGDQQTNHGHAEGVGFALRIEVGLQFLQIRHHGVERQLQHQRPARVGLTDAERQVQLDAALFLVDRVSHFAAFEIGQVGGLPGVEDVADFFAEFARVLGVRDDPAVAADQGHLPGAAVQLLVGAEEHFLNEVHRQVGADDALEGTVKHDRLDKGGEHDDLVADLVRRRIDHAGFLRFLRAQVVLAGAHAGGQGFLVVDVDQFVQAEGAVIVAEPPRQEAPVGGIDANDAGADVGRVIVVQGVLFPADVSAENLRVLLDVFFDQADQLLAADAQAWLAIGARRAEQGVDSHQAAGNQQRRLELALDLADLGLRQRGQALFDDLLELRLGALLHHLLRARTGEQRIQHQCGDHTEHDGAGQGGDGKLDRLELHGSSARKRTSALMYRQRALGHECEPEQLKANVANGSVRDAVARDLAVAVNFLRQLWWETSESRCNTSVVSGVDTITRLGYAQVFRELLNEQDIGCKCTERSAVAGRLSVGQHHQRRCRGCGAQAVHVQHAVLARGRPDVCAVVSEDRRRGVQQRCAGQDQSRGQAGSGDCQPSDCPGAELPSGRGAMAVGSQSDQER